MSAKILLVEDEKSMSNIIVYNLEDEDYDVTLAENGSQALELFDKERFDLIILDIMLPEIDGFDVYESIRLKDQYTPILFLTARNDQRDKIRGLSLGADDYITKPFDLSEFLLRIKNIIRRAKPQIQSQDIYVFANNSFDFNKMEASNSRETIQLSAKEAKMLKLLLDHKNEVVSRDMILEKVWGYDVYPTTRTIDNFIVKLRKFFEENPKRPEIILSIRGIGYKLVSR